MRGARRRPPILVTAWVAVWATVPAAHPQSPPAEALSWPILFTGGSGDARGIFCLDAPGARPVPLGGGPRRDNRAVPSPDGSRIAFQSQRDGNYEIYLVERGGREARNLTRHPAFDGLPSWSPDGRRIAFFSRREVDESVPGQFPGHLFVMDADGGGVERLPVPPLTTTLGPSDWSPDGRRLLLTREHDGRFDLVSLSLEDFTETRLTSDDAVEGSATFSPDGSRIAFYADRRERSDLVILDPASGERRALSTEGGWHYYPEWSPDGAWITTTSKGENDQYDILVWAADGSSRAVIVATPGDERESVWLPGGSAGCPAPTR